MFYIIYSYFEFENFCWISVFSVVNIRDSLPNINKKKKSSQLSSAFFHYNNNYIKLF